MYRVVVGAGSARSAKFAFLAAAAVVVAGCSVSSDLLRTPTVERGPAMYGALVDNSIKIPAVPTGRVAAQYQRQIVTTPSRIVEYKPGTVVVDTGRRFLYLVKADGKSMRYGIGVGRAGFAWAGEATIKAKRRWPSWYPPKEMIARDPLAAEWANGMPGGLDNPLGSRALYLFEGNRDTLYRLHGTNDPRSIGKAISSGCVRLVNQDIMDLYKRVSVGTRVVVLGQPSLNLPDIAKFFTSLLDVYTL